jgi:hypothetical protein
MSEQDWEKIEGWTRFENPVHLENVRTGLEKIIGWIRFKNPVYLEIK